MCDVTWSKWQCMKLKVDSLQVSPLINPFHIVKNPPQFIFRGHEHALILPKLRSWGSVFGRQRVDHLEVASGVVGGPVMPGGVNGVLEFLFFSLLWPIWWPPSATFESESLEAKSQRFAPAWMSGEPAERYQEGGAGRVWRPRTNSWLLKVCRTSQKAGKRDTHPSKPG